MHILIAPNAFKHALSADDAAEAILTGLRRSGVACSCTCFPVGDGGDGTADLLIKKLGGRKISANVLDPLGRTIAADFGMTGNDTAVIEMANASGIKLLEENELNPMIASSRGTGQLILSALDNGAKNIIICLGGSATVDGGIGILEALGIQLHGGKIDMSSIDKRLRGIGITVLSDVRNKLLGPDGAARVFGPQKGADSKMISLLEDRLESVAASVKALNGKNIDIERAGAAGGAAAGLYGLLDARLVDGIDHFLELTGFEKELEKADVVITGEGRIDEQTLQGKAPFGVAKLAKKHGKKVIALAGQIPDPPSVGLMRYFDSIQTINITETDLSTALQNTCKNLVATASQLGDLLHSR